MENKEKVSTEAKKSTKKTSSNKDAEAKAKVTELLKGTNVAGLVVTPVEEKTNELDVTVIKKEKSMSWMEQQVNDLTEQVETLENEILYYKEELVKLQNRQGNEITNVTDQSLPPNLVALFRHFEQAYESGYTYAKLAWPEGGTGVLDMFLQYFPQLVNVKRYKYKGQER
jgi:chromosome segregation ATPase